MNARVLRFPSKDGAAPKDPGEVGFEDVEPIKWVGRNKMDEAKARLTELGVRFAQIDEHTLRVRGLSYYPTKGTVVRDGFGRSSRKGLDHFEQVLRALKYIPGEQ